MADERQTLDQLLDAAVEAIPSSGMYPTEAARAVTSDVLQVAYRASEAIQDALANPVAVAHPDQLEALSTALWRDVDPVLDLKTGAIHRAVMSKTDRVAAPTFRGDVIRALSRVKATFDQLGALRVSAPTVQDAAQLSHDVPQLRNAAMPLQPAPTSAALVIGRLVDMIAQAYAAAHPLPAAPTSTGTGLIDAENEALYIEALAAHAKANERVRGFGKVVRSVLALAEEDRRG